MTTIIQLNQHPITRQRRAAEAASLQARREGFSVAAAKGVAQDTACRIRLGNSAAMAIHLAIRAGRSAQHSRPQA